MSNNCQNIPEETIKMVVARLETLPPNLVFSNGSGRVTNPSHDPITTFFADWLC